MQAELLDTTTRPSNLASRLMRQITATSLVSIAICAALYAPSAFASDARFAMTCIGTETGSAVNFRYRWGSSDEWKSAKAKPGSWQVITYNYRFRGENRSPRLEVRYDDDLSDGVNFVRQRVFTYAARTKNCEAEGFTYNFFNRGGELFLLTEDQPTGADSSI